jgi:hypothetical protein
MIHLGLILFVPTLSVLCGLSSSGNLFCFKGFELNCEDLVLTYQFLTPGSLLICNTKCSILCQSFNFFEISSFQNFRILYLDI